MTGRRVLKLDTYFSLEELKQKTDAFASPLTDGCRIGRPTPASMEEYLLIPATEHYTVAAIVRKPSFFSRSPRLVLFICDTPEGVKAQAAASAKARSVYGGYKQIKKTLSLKEERKGPAENALLAVTDCMREIFRDRLLP